MGKNLILDIADKLNLIVGEEFKISNQDEKTLFRFTETWIECKEESDETWYEICDDVLLDLITGKTEIFKIPPEPFEPKIGDLYYTYFGLNFEPNFTYAKEEAEFYQRKAAGCCFRNLRHAIIARPQKYKELTGKDWSNI